MNKRLCKVGLTGGIATGKSVTMQQWEECGAVGIDADDLAHQTLAPDTPTWHQVVRTFGEDILNDDQTVNRRKLGGIVFTDDTKRQALNRIVHPAVREMWTDRVAALEREGRADCVVVSIPLLYEVAVEAEFDCVVVVGCSEPTQLARLAKKRFDEAQARARIRAQWPVQKKMDRADFVIWNDGSRRVLSEQAKIVWANIKEVCHATNQN